MAETPANAADFGGEDGASARFYGIRPADVVKMRALQDRVRAWEGPDLKGKREGSFGIGLDACKLGAGPAPDAVASFYIRNDPAGAFRPLLRRARLTSVLGPEVMAQIPACPGAK
ncbi:hypothetical protein [Pseudorhodobacter sp. E13]|uniref:hypothetical protein n=1 Tax=Pseudorhodobacter sp. E13 TaxID=2487931 RepID=UPI000F8D6835|nr:hypothetical protein [Pseudorhodobacter sp. E13]